MLSRQRCCCGPLPDSCPTKICVKGCDNSIVVGATVNIYDAATCTTLISTCTTDATGCCTVQITRATSPADYCVTVTGTGWFAYKKVLTLACNGTTNIKLLGAGTNGSIWFKVIGCCGQPQINAVIHVGGVDLVTDSGGNAKAGFTEGGTYHWTIAKNRYAGQSGDVSILTCGNTTALVNIVLLPSAGFACAPGGCGQTPAPPGFPEPVSTTLHLTDSRWGVTDLFFNSVTGNWEGTLTVHYSHGFPVLPGCIDTVFSFQYTSNGACGAIGFGIANAYCGRCVNGIWTKKAVGFQGPMPVDISTIPPCPPTGTVDPALEPGGSGGLNDCSNTPSCTVTNQLPYVFVLTLLTVAAGPCYNYLWALGDTWTVSE
jgi:hypothetical protein